MSQLSLPGPIETPRLAGQIPRADKLTRAAFNALSGLPIPEHLIALVNELEGALAAGGVRLATHAA